MQGAGGVGGLLAVTEHDSAGNEIYYATYDANGNVSEYIDDSGTVVAHYEYCPFGQLTEADGPKADDFAHRFSTKYLDSETELYYYGFRYYSSELGRWISRDPIEEQGGLNLYGFVGNRPVNVWDVLGLSMMGIRDDRVYHVPTQRRWLRRQAQWDKAVYIGRVDEQDVVTTPLPPCHHLKKVPLSAVENVISWSETENIHDVVGGLRAYEEVARHHTGGYTGKGTNPADYWQYRVKCEPCNEDKLNEELRCRREIGFAAGNQVGKTKAAGTAQAGVAAACYIAGAKNVYNPLGWICLATGATVSLPALKDFRTVAAIMEASRIAGNEYCDCTPYLDD